MLLSVLFPYTQTLWKVFLYSKNLDTVLVLFLELKFQGNNSQPHYFSPIPKRFTIFFIYSYFNNILHFIFNFTLLFCHSFYYEFILTDLWQLPVSRIYS